MPLKPLSQLYHTLSYAKGGILLIGRNVNLFLKFLVTSPFILSSVKPAQVNEWPIHFIPKVFTGAVVFLSME